MSASGNLSSDRMIHLELYFTINDNAVLTFLLLDNIRQNQQMIRHKAQGNICKNTLAPLPFFGQYL